MKRNRSLLIKIIVFIIFLSLISFYIPKEPLQNLVKNSGVFAPIVFVLINLTTFIFAPLSGTPVMATGYFLFGKTVILYGFVVITLATITNFWIARMWGIKIVTKLVGKESMKDVNNFTKEYGLIALFFSRLMLIGFVDVISYAAGLTTMKFAPYFVISILASIPNTLLVYLLADKITNTAQFTILIVGLSYIMLMLFLFLRKKGN